MTVVPLPSPMCSAALLYARHGWPVFPCRQKDGEPYQNAKGETVTPRAKAPYLNGCVSKDPDASPKATTDEAQIKTWWKRWPNALIGLATGRNGCLVLDFDPRIDDDTGEVFTLDTLKTALETQMECPLPASLTSMTPSEGVHVFLRQPDDGGPPIRNRGNLPKHVDVRGLGGYVIGPPSVIESGENATAGRYRWLRGKLGDDVAAAPAALIEILRAPKGPAERPAPATPGADGSVPSPRPSRLGDLSAEDEAVRMAIGSYGIRALSDELRAVRSAGGGQRNNQLNESALKIASLTVSMPFPALDAGIARAMLEQAAAENPGRDDAGALHATIESGWSAGKANARDLAEIAASARDRHSRFGAPRASRAAAASEPSRSPPPVSDDDGKPSSHGGGSAATGGGKGCGPGPNGAWADDLTLECGFLPQTDLGNLERFLARYGKNFLYVEAWGWLAWDGQRWNRDMAMPLLGRAVQETMRAIQLEAGFIRSSGVPFPPEDGDVELHDDDDDDVGGGGTRFIRDLIKKKKKLKSDMWFRQRLLARESGGEGPRHDAIVQVKSNGDIVLLSEKVATWGRSSEGAGHIMCIAKMAEARLSAKPDEFDGDPLAINLQNCALQFHRPEGGKPAWVEERAHRRDDRMTKIARIAYDTTAKSPIFDAFLERVQPNLEMREWLDRWGGYNALGLADAQKMAVFYGEGQNGKGVWVQSHAWLLGDYAWTTGIDTFMDAGRKRTGGGPTTDLAALAGRRMVYANEPDDQSKFSDGLVKSLTSDEPIGGVRELMKPPFELPVTFTNTIMANTLPRIGTDYGIRRRMQVVPWGVIIPVEERDDQLKYKIRAELPGVLNRVVAGALAYLTDGLPLPQEMVEATQQYHEENDILMTFLDLCVARSPGDKLGATALHRLFEAWQTWAQLLPASGKAWSAKYLNAQMQKKGFKINKASTMQWHDIVPRYDATDFTDHEGKPVERDLGPPQHVGKASAGAPIVATSAAAAAPPVPSRPEPPAPDRHGGYDDDWPI